MIKRISRILCIVFALMLLAGCQNNTDIPYVTGPGAAQSGQPQQGSTSPQDGRQDTPPSTQSGEQVPQNATTGPEGIAWPTQEGSGGQFGGQQGGQQTAQTDPAEFVLPTPEKCTYEQYQAMNGEQQEAFFQQFKGDFEAFFAWMDAAKAASEANSDDIVIEPDATIDLDDIFGKDK